MEATHRALERLYLEAPINAFYRPSVRINEREAEIRIAVRPEFHHALGAAHGSVAFKLLDDAAFFAANSVVPDEWVLTASFNLHFLRPAVSGELVAKGRLVHASRRVLLAEAVVLDEAGKEVARGSGSFMRSGVPIDGVPKRA